MTPQPPAEAISTRLPPSGRRRRVLVSGATGYLAGQLLPVLRSRYDLVLLDVRDTDGLGRPVAGVLRADLLADDLERLRPRFAGVEALVHLAYYRPPGTGVSGEGKTYADERPNVDMAERVYRLALEAGVARVVVASSNRAGDWYEPLLEARRLELVGPTDLPRSTNFYGWAKIAYEALGFAYACGGFGRKLEVVQLRIGAPREVRAGEFVGRPAAYKRDLGAYLSARDFQQLVVRSIEAERIEDEWGVPFQVFYGVSNNTRAFWSIASARRLLGYDPEDDSELRFASDIQRLLIDADQAGRLG